MLKKNPNSILFLYEGDTELEFYSRVINKYIPQRKIRITASNLDGVYNLDKKVKNRINEHLLKNLLEEQITVIVAYDRDGRKEKESRLMVEFVKSKIEQDLGPERILSINEIIATQDIESWFLKDIDGVYKYLRVPHKERTNKYQNTESFNCTDLSNLFRRYRKNYQKGSRAEGFIEALDIDIIYNNTPELKEGIKIILDLIK
jgi:hypothetical protein